VTAETGLGDDGNRWNELHAGADRITAHDPHAVDDIPTLPHW
jgi:hypothetical protein